MSTSHSATSNAALTSSRKTKGLFINLIRAYLDHASEGATSSEIEQRFNLPHQTVSAYLSQLERDAEICRNGVTRPSPSGNPSFAYFSLRFVPVEEREPVIRKGELVFDWKDIEEDRITRLIKEWRNAAMMERDH